MHQNPWGTKRCVPAQVYEGVGGVFLKNDGPRSDRLDRIAGRTVSPTMRFKLRHPIRADVRVRYGWDRVLGFFIELRDDRARLEYDALQDDYDGLTGALTFLVFHRFFDQADLDAALERLHHELPEQMPARLERIATVIVNFQRGAE